MDAPAPTVPATERERLRLQLRTGYFTLEAMNGLATSFFIYYIFFFTEQQFHFTKADNLLLTSFYGFTYMAAAASAGRLAQRLGRFRLLRMGFAGMMVSLLVGAAAPKVFGYTTVTVAIEFAVLIVWTVSTSTGWPTLQGLLSREASSGEYPRIVGIYNLIWAGTSGVAFLTGGSLFGFSKGGDASKLGTVFLLPVVIHIVQLVLLGRLERRAGDVDAAVSSSASVPRSQATSGNVERATRFVRLALIANPFAYVAVYGFAPVIPQLARRFEMSDALAGVVFSVWFWSRLGAFYCFWQWPGWHYRFRWLLTAFIATIGCFFVMLLSPFVWMVVAAEFIFGLAIGLIYYSSLFYSMDAGASGTKKGGFHEAAIGLGIGAGPLVGFVALRVFPGNSNAGTWNIGGALAVGLVLFLASRLRWPRRRKT